MDAPVLAAPYRQQVVIGVGDMAVSNNHEAVLSTYALGSCIGLVAYDPAVRAGGMLHLMLPDSAISPDKAAAQPAMFADTGLPQFFRQLASFRTRPARLRLLVAGGANVIHGTDPFRIGERNLQATVDYLARHGFAVTRAEVGGAINRTLHLDLATGIATVKTAGGRDEIPLAA
jgi:chemotaxis protein CheD